MTLKVVLSTLSGIVFIFAFIPYIREILWGDASPRKATWLVWAVGDIIILTGMLAKGTTSGLIIGATLGASTVFLLSLKYGEPGWTKRDKVCISLSAVAIGLWMYFGESNLGIALSLIALAIAAWPTYVSAWRKPGNESRVAWVLFNTSNLLAILAIPSVTFADMSAPIAFMMIDVPMLYLLFIRPRISRDQEPKTRSQ